MLRQHQAMWSGHLGAVTATEHRIVLQGRDLVDRRHTGPDIPYQGRNRTHAHAGRIEPSMSEWTSPVVIVHKHDGSARFCVDYRKLNASTIRDFYPIPQMDDCIDSLEEAKIFTTLDCSSVYSQIPIHEAYRTKQRLSPKWLHIASA